MLLLLRAGVPLRCFSTSLEAINHLIYLRLRETASTTYSLYELREGQDARLVSNHYCRRPLRRVSASVSPNPGVEVSAPVC